MSPLLPTWLDSLPWHEPFRPPLSLFVILRSSFALEWPLVLGLLLTVPYQGFSRTGALLWTLSPFSTPTQVCIPVSVTPGPPPRSKPYPSYLSLRGSLWSTVSKTERNNPQHGILSGALHGLSLCLPCSPLPHAELVSPPERDLTHAGSRGNPNRISCQMVAETKATTWGACTTAVCPLTVRESWGPASPG